MNREHPPIPAAHCSSTTLTRAGKTYKPDTRRFTFLTIRKGAVDLSTTNGNLNDRAQTPPGPSGQLERRFTAGLTGAFLPTGKKKPPLDFPIQRAGGWSIGD